MEWPRGAREKVKRGSRRKPSHSPGPLVVGEEAGSKRDTARARGVRTRTEELDELIEAKG